MRSEEPITKAIRLTTLRYTIPREIRGRRRRHSRRHVRVLLRPLSIRSFTPSADICETGQISTSCKLIDGSEILSEREQQGAAASQATAPHPPSTVLAYALAPFTTLGLTTFASSRFNRLKFNTANTASVTTIPIGTRG